MQTYSTTIRLSFTAGAGEAAVRPFSTSSMLSTVTGEVPAFSAGVHDHDAPRAGYCQSIVDVEIDDDSASLGSCAPNCAGSPASVRTCLRMIRPAAARACRS